MNNTSKHNPWSWVPSLYFIEGLPYVMVNTLSVVLYTDLGIPNGKMAFYTSLIYLPWVLKFVWSPFVDILRTKRWWILTMQWVMALTLALVAFLIPSSFYFAATLAVFWVTAFASATHDIAADGYYMLALDQNKQAFFVGIRSTFYRFAVIFGQGLLVALAGVFDNITGDKAESWQLIFLISAVILAIAASAHTFTLPKNVRNDTQSAENKSFQMIIAEFGDTFGTFFRKPGIWLAIVFMLLYRLPEALILKLAYPFLLGPVESGGLALTKEEVGLAYGIIGVGGLLVGGIVGGVVASRDGLRHWIKPMAWAMSLTCLTFLILSLIEQPSLWAVNACILIEQFGYGFGFSAYMLYLLYFSKGEYATSHYAICTAFMAASMMIPGMFAGWLQEQMGYTMFFAFAMLCCVATIVVASLVKVDPAFGKKNTEK